MKVRTALAVIGLAAAAAVVWMAATANAAPTGDPADGCVVITPNTGSMPDAQRTPPPGASTAAPDFEAGIEEYALDADGNVVPPTVTVLGDS